MFLLQKGFLETGEGAQLVKNIGAVYNISLLEAKGKNKPVLQWVVDLKNGTGSA